MMARLQSSMDHIPTAAEEEEEGSMLRSAEPRRHDPVGGVGALTRADGAPYYGSAASSSAAAAAAANTTPTTPTAARQQQQQHYKQAYRDEEDCGEVDLVRSASSPFEDYGRPQEMEPPMPAISSTISTYSASAAPASSTMRTLAAPAPSTLAATATATAASSTTSVAPAAAAAPKLSLYEELIRFQEEQVNDDESSSAADDERNAKIKTYKTADYDQDDDNQDNNLDKNHNAYDRKRPSGAGKEASASHYFRTTPHVEADQMAARMANMHLLQQQQQQQQNHPSDQHDDQHQTAAPYRAPQQHQHQHQHQQQPRNPYKAGGGAATTTPEQDLIAARLAGLDPSILEAMTKEKSLRELVIEMQIKALKGGGGDSDHHHHHTPYDPVQLARDEELARKLQEEMNNSQPSDILTPEDLRAIQEAEEALRREEEAQQEEERRKALEVARRLEQEDGAGCGGGFETGQYEMMARLSRGGEHSYSGRVGGFPGGEDAVMQGEQWDIMEEIQRKREEERLQEVLRLSQQDVETPVTAIPLMMMMPPGGHAVGAHPVEYPPMDAGAQRWQQYIQQEQEREAAEAAAASAYEDHVGGSSGAYPMAETAAFHHGSSAVPAAYGGAGGAYGGGGGVGVGATTAAYGGGASATPAAVAAAYASGGAGAAALSAPSASATTRPAKAAREEPPGDWKSYFDQERSDTPVSIPEAIARSESMAAEQPPPVEFVEAHHHHPAGTPVPPEPALPTSIARTVSQPMPASVYTDRSNSQANLQMALRQSVVSTPTGSSSRQLSVPPAVTTYQTVQYEMTEEIPPRPSELRQPNTAGALPSQQTTTRGAMGNRKAAPEEQSFGQPLHSESRQGTPAAPPPLSNEMYPREGVEVVQKFMGKFSRVSPALKPEQEPKQRLPAGSQQQLAQDTARVYEAGFDDEEEEVPLKPNQAGAIFPEPSQADHHGQTRQETRSMPSVPPVNQRDSSINFMSPNRQPSLSHGVLVSENLHPEGPTNLSPVSYRNSLPHDAPASSSSSLVRTDGMGTASRWVAGTGDEMSPPFSRRITAIDDDEIPPPLVARNARAEDMPSLPARKPMRAQPGIGLPGMSPRDAGLAQINQGHAIDPTSPRTNTLPPPTLGRARSQGNRPGASRETQERFDDDLPSRPKMQRHLHTAAETQSPPYMDRSFPHHGESAHPPRQLHRATSERSSHSSGSQSSRWNYPHSREAMARPPAADSTVELSSPGLNRSRSLHSAPSSPETPLNQVLPAMLRAPDVGDDEFSVPPRPTGRVQSQVPSPRNSQPLGLPGRAPSDVGDDEFSVPPRPTGRSPSQVPTRNSQPLGLPGRAPPLHAQNPHSHQPHGRPAAASLLDDDPEDLMPPPASRPAATAQHLPRQRTGDLHQKAETTPMDLKSSFPSEDGPRPGSRPTNQRSESMAMVAQQKPARIGRRSQSGTGGTIQQDLIRKGQAKTKQAVKSGQSIVVSCQGCDKALHAPVGFDFVYCPHCGVVSTVSGLDPNHTNQGSHH